MSDMEKVIKELELVKQDIYEIFVSGSQIAVDCLRIDNALALLKKQEAQKFFVDESGKITPLPVVVRCKDCKYAPGNKEGYTCKIRDILGMYMKNPDYFFCADGERK